MARRSVGRGLNLLAKAQEDVEPGWLEGWLSLPLLPPSTAGCASPGLQGLLFSTTLQPRQKDFSATRGYTKKLLLTFLMSFSNQIIHFKSGSC